MRKIYYNITITALSVAVALIIGSIELIGVFAEQLSLTGGVWDFVAGLDLNLVGYAIVACSSRRGSISLAVWRFGRIEQRWCRATAGVLSRGAPRPRRSGARRAGRYSVAIPLMSSCESAQRAVW